MISKFPNISAASAALGLLATAAIAQAAPVPPKAGAPQAATAVAASNPNGTGVANGRTGGQPMPDEPLPAQPQAQPTPSQ